MDVKNILYPPTVPPTLKTVVADCVAETSTRLLAQLQVQDPNITGIWFQHGHPLEVIKQLEILKGGTSTKAMRYPLVALFRDFPEVNGETPGIDSEPKINLIIATRTDPAYTSDQRETKSFNPILIPIKNELLHQFEMSGRFMTLGADQQNFTAIEHYFWGRESVYGAAANIFNDWIDCIEFKNLNFKLYE